LRSGWQPVAATCPATTGAETVIDPRRPSRDPRVRSCRRHLRCPVSYPFEHEFTQFHGGDGEGTSAPVHHRVVITAMAPGQFGVEVTEGDVTTSHRVRVPDDLVDGVFAGQVDPEILVRESIEYLLEREPATSILEEFSLDDIANYYDSYVDDLRERVS
jgi:hypothetical protein